MIKNKKIVSTLAIMLILSTVVIASSRIANIKVVYDNIKIVVDGKEVNFGLDSEGKKIEPFIYNGTTYLPVRAVGEAIGKDVSWDQSSKTVFLGSAAVNNNFTQVNTEEKDLVNTLNAFNETRRVYVYKSGKNKGIELQLYDNTETNINYNLEGKYTNISCLVGVEEASKKGTLKFIGDGRTLAEYPIESDKMADNVNVDVTGVKNLMIQLHSDEPTFITIKLVDLKIR